MKNFRFYLLLAFMLLPLGGWAQEKLFDKYSDMKDIKSIYISKSMLDMGPHLFADLYLGSAAKHLNSVRLLSTSSPAACKEMFDDIRSLLKSSKYEMLMKQRGESSSSEFYIIRRGDKIKALVMLMYRGEKALKFIYLEGDMTEADVKSILLYQGRASTDDPRPYFDGTKGLGQLDDLTALKDLQALSDLKNLEKYMDEDAWKEFKEQMENLREQLEELDVEIARN